MQDENNTEKQIRPPRNVVRGAWLFVIFHYALLGWLFFFLWIMEGIGIAWGDAPSGNLRFWGIVFLIIAAILPTFALRIMGGERKVAKAVIFWCRLVAWGPLPLFLAGSFDKEFLFLAIMALPLALLGIVSTLLRSDSAKAWFDSVDEDSQSNL